MRRISRLETQVADLRADNDAAMKRIDLSTDLDKIKEQALGLGMKYATSDQIIYYDIEDNDYMKPVFGYPKAVKYSGIQRDRACVEDVKKERLYKNFQKRCRRN